MTRLAVFDWNGTLFDDTAATLAATNTCLAHLGKPPATLERVQDLFTFPLVHFYERMGVAVDDYLREAEHLGDVFLKSYEAAAQSCRAMQGADDLLRWLRDAGIPCMILSNHLEDRVKRDAARLGLSEYMQHISGTHTYATITTGTNKRERLETYMQQNGFTPQQSFIIGDSHEEPEIARHLGLFGISITGGLMSPERLQKHKADGVIHSLNELRPILEKQWNLTGR